MSEKDALQASEKQDALKGIIRDLHAGVPAEKLRKTFARLIKNTSPEEIADMENALIEEGFPVEEVQRLCDVHAQVFDKALKKAGKPGKIPGHPIHTFVQENKAAKAILKELKRAAKPLGKGVPRPEEAERFGEALGRLREIEKHYARKENQLFSALEAKGFTGPTKVMWGKHDEVRALLKKAGEELAKKNWPGAAATAKTISGAVKKLIFLEEKILYPTSARKLTTVDWARIKRGEHEIGYAWVKPSNLWDAQLAEAAEKAPDYRPAAPGPSAPPAPSPGPASPAPSDGTIDLSRGRLTPEQVDLLLKKLPVDVTFVDENDRVRYYSDTEERIFPRSPEVIGRQVQNCHPPKSLNVVSAIVEAFKAKTKDKAEFWIQKGGRFILIRYFPLYDDAGKYRGVLEVSQDATEIRALQGERRLLDW
ncbi:MAG: DUF438 domain-containing protein [Candidatus Aminicenantes bacterium]|nr:DUF438 domain-containing protein [Candidatus Aminicenantes bacterium]